MKTTAFTLIFLAGAALFSGCTTHTARTANVLSNEKARDSYALGMYFGHGWKEHGVDVDSDLLVRGINDAESGGATLLTPEEMKDALNNLKRSVAAYAEKMRAEAAMKNQEAAETNHTEGEAFLAQNKTKPGITTLPDGLQYKILADGQGDSPAPDDIVTVNYRGTFVDGTEFDSSEKAGRPIQFPVRGVIPGWTEALQKMKVGSKWQLFVPANLAYGHNGHPPVVGPDETLIFEIELLSVAHQRPSAAPPAQPLTSDIIKVPSAEELKKGAQIETIKASDVQKMQQTATNSN